MVIPPDALALIGTSAKWLSLGSPAAIAVWRLLSHDRTLLYALLPWLGKKVDARKRADALLSESHKAYAARMKTLGRDADQLTQKLLKAAPAKRVLIERDLEYIEARQREATIKFAAFQDLANDPPKQDPVPSADPAITISAHWMDQFDELVRRRNEDWRALLLKDALVREARAPGSISPRVLWLLGVLETEKFELLAALLNVASVIDGFAIIPGINLSSDRRQMPGGFGKDSLLGATIVALGDTGLLHGDDIGRHFENGETFRCGYDGGLIEVTPLHSRLQVTGQLFTSLGNTVAGLYRATPNAFGKRLFDHWVASLPAERYTVRRL